MLDINWNPSPRDLRQFGLLWLPLFAAVVGYVVVRRTGEWPIPLAIWGVAAVVALTSLGNGIRESVSGQITDLGPNLITVSPGSEEGDGGGIIDARSGAE